MTALDTDPARPGSDRGEELDHLVCCDEDTALCGADVSGFSWGEGHPDPALMCVVCLDLEGKGCPGCVQ